MAADPDVALMLELKAGDEEAFVKLYRQYRDRLFNFSRRLLGDAALAEEATQDVFLKLYRARERYTPTSRFSTYVYRIARNHCLNLKARHENTRVDRHRVAEEVGSHAATAEAMVERSELRAALQRALAVLPENQATALVLAHYDGMSYREVAEVLEVSESATKSLIHRARARLSQELKSLRPQEHEVNHALH